VNLRPVLVAAAVLAGGTRPAPAAVASFDHSIWNRLLATYVDDAGRVAYRDLQEHDMPLFQVYLDSLGSATPDRWPTEEQLAFWINAYNAGLVLAVLQGQSAESLIGRARLFKTWEFRVAGTDRSPDDIEHGILRKRFSEPRIHFAIVCASTSCPRLRREAYVAARLDAQLDDQTRRFVNDPARNVIDPKTRTLKLSKIFDWFQEDFVKAAGSVTAFVARWVQDPEARAWLRSGPVKIEYLDYDWSLNVQPEERPLRRRGP